MEHTNPRTVALAVLAAMSLASCGCQQSPPTSSEPPPVEVAVAQPLVTPIVEWDEYTGRFAAIDSVEVRARVSGYLQSTHFEEGLMVEQGDLLAIIDPRPFEAELSASRARLEEAKAKLAESQSLVKQAEAEKADADAQLTLANRRLERSQQLLVNNAVAKEEVDVRESEQLQATAAVEAALAQIDSAKAGIATASAGVKTAEANIESAALNLQYTRIRAPVSGRISRRLVTEGNLISGGTNQSTLLTTIVSLDPIHVYFDANEQEFLKYARLSREGTRASSRDVKNPVYVSLVDEQGYPHKGHMDFVDNKIDPNTGTMRGRAILPNTEDNLLTPGLFATVRIPGSGRYQAVLLPDSAIGSDQTDKFVYLVNSDNKIERQKVTLGPLTHGLRVIRSGLEGSQRVVIRGLQSVFPDSQVKPVEEQIEAQTVNQLPDDYQPVPKEQWLSREVAPVPEAIEPNANPRREPATEADSAEGSNEAT